MDMQMTFYFDVEDHNIVAHLSQHIKNLGGECTSFFSKDVTHLITNRHAAKKGEITITTVPNPVTITPSSTSILDKSTPGPSSTAIQASTAGWGSKEPMFDDNMSDVNQSKRSSTAFKLLASNLTPSSNCSPSTLLHHSRTQQKYDLISKASAMNTTIWTVEQLYHYLQRLYAQSSEDLLKGAELDLKKNKQADLLNCLLAEKRQAKTGNVLAYPTPVLGLDAASIFGRQGLRQSTRLNATTASGGHGAPKNSGQPLVLQYCVFEHPYVMIEDTLGLHRPLFKEFKPVKPSKTPVVPMLYWNAPTGHCPFIKPSSSVSARKRTTENVESEKVAAASQSSASRASAPKRLSPVKSRSKYVKLKRAGYCECCLEKYSDMEEHARQPLHRKFAVGKEHFASLDKLIVALQRPLLRPALEPHDHARSISTPKSHFAMDTDTMAVLDDQLLSAKGKHRLREIASTSRGGKCRTLGVDILVKSIERNESESESPLCIMTPNDELAGPSSPLMRKRKELHGKREVVSPSESDAELPEQQAQTQAKHEPEPESKIPVESMQMPSSSPAGHESKCKCKLVRKTLPVNLATKRELRASTLTVSFNSKCGVSSPSLKPASSPKTLQPSKRKLSPAPRSLVSSQAHIAYYSSEADEFSFRDIDAVPSCSVPPAKKFLPSLLTK